MRRVGVAISVAALGYFVDIYDLLLFGVVRIPSLTSLGVVGDAAIRTEGEFIMNIQMIGLLLGGIIWGIIGDKRGRLSVLFGSIFLYSIANLGNAFIQDVGMYALLRFIAGIGLAGELGAGVTLVSEIMSKEKRGYGTAVIASFGLLGAVAAGIIGRIDWGLPYENWRIAYVIGACLGFCLLIMRIGVYESGMYKSMKQANVPKGDFLTLITRGGSSIKYLKCILIGISLWFVIGILVFQAPEFAKSLGQSFQVEAPKAIAIAYLGLSIGDLASGVLSQLLKSRKKALFIFLTLSLLTSAHYLTLGAVSEWYFYLVIFGLGFSVGYWAVFVTVGSEQFGTNIRSTVTTTVPNFVRGALAPMTMLFQALREYVFDGAPGADIKSAFIVLALLFAIAFTTLYFLEETYGKNLDYFEQT